MSKEKKAAEMISELTDIPADIVEEITESSDFPEMILKNDEQAIKIFAAMLVLVMEKAAIPYCFKFLLNSLSKSYSKEGIIQLLSEELINLDEDEKKALFMDVVYMVKITIISTIL